MIKLTILGTLFSRSTPRAKGFEADITSFDKPVFGMLCTFSLLVSGRCQLIICHQNHLMILFLHLYKCFMRLEKRTSFTDVDVCMWILVSWWKILCTKLHDHSLLLLAFFKRELSAANKEFKTINQIKECYCFWFLVIWVHSLPPDGLHTSSFHSLYNRLQHRLASLCIHHMGDWQSKQTLLQNHPL